MISVALLDGRESTWDAFVASTPDGTFCHLASWRGVMDDVLGHECLYAWAYDDTGRGHALLPLVRVRSRLFGDYLVSMPFLNAGGPIGSPEGVAALLDYAVTKARSFGVRLLELRMQRPVPTSLRVSSRKITVRLALPESSDALWKRLDAKLRSQIRRPQKEGFVMRFGVHQVGAFYEVFTRNMRSLGTPVLPLRFFERIAGLLPAAVACGVVYRGEQPVAAGFGFLWKDELEMTWASSLREYSRQAPNMLLYWSFLEYAIGHRVRTFDFGRCTPGGGTHHFKLQWGGVDALLPWVQWSSRNVVTTPSPDRPAYKLAAAVWRRLPLAVTNRIGPLLARQLP